MSKLGKAAKVIPNDKALFQIHVVSFKSGDRLFFKLGGLLNNSIKGKRADGIYSFTTHKEILKGLFFTHKRHICKECWKFLLDRHPKVIEELLGVKVLHNKRISTVKWNEFFEKKNTGKNYEVFPTDTPPDSVEYPLYYEVETTLDGKVLNESEF